MERVESGRKGPLTPGARERDEQEAGAAGGHWMNLGRERADDANRPDSGNRMSRSFTSLGAQILVAPQASELMGNPD